MNFSLRHSQRTWSSRILHKQLQIKFWFLWFVCRFNSAPGCGLEILKLEMTSSIFYCHPKNNPVKRLWPGSARAEPNRAKNCSTSLFLNADPNGEDRSDWRFLYKKFCRFFDYKELKKVMENILEKAFINIILSNTALRG